MKWKYKSLMFLILMLFCVGGVCATDPDNNTTINDVTVVNESSNLNVAVSSDLNNISCNLTHDKIVGTDNDLFMKLVKEKFKNKSIGDSGIDMLHSVSKEELDNYYAYLNVRGNLSSNSQLNLTIDELMNLPLNDKTSGLVLNATINYIDYIIDYDISQLRCYLKSQLSESSKIDSNETVINLTKTIDNNLKSKTDNLKKLKNFLISLQDYYKTKIYKNNIPSNKTNNLILDNKCISDGNHLKLFQKDLKSMIGDLNLMTKYLKSIKESLISIKEFSKFIFK